MRIAFASVAVLWLTACESSTMPASDAALAVDAAVDAAPDIDDAADAAPVVDAVAEDEDVPRVRVVPTEWPRTPPPMPAYSGGACPTLRAGPTSAEGLNAAFASGGHARQFRLIVPRSYDPAGTDRWPLLVAWHWLAGDSAQMVTQGEIELSAERYHMIVAVPDQLRVDGATVNPFNWPFIAPAMAEPELVFGDDMLACVSSQFRVDPARVHGMGVSAGALWLTFVMSTPRASHFASVAILSGGLGELLPAWHMAYAPQPNKYPAFVLWGGVRDHFLIDFDLASQRLRDALVDDGHFVETCTHENGHALPPLTAAAPGESKFAVLWRFFADHPYGLAPATSPYLAAGLPPALTPSWCSIPSEITGDARDR